MVAGGPHAERELARTRAVGGETTPIEDLRRQRADLNLIQGENVLKERGVNAVLRLNGYPGIVIALWNAGIVSEFAQPNVCDEFARLIIRDGHHHAIRGVGIRHARDAVGGIRRLLDKRIQVGARMLVMDGAEALGVPRLLILAIDHDGRLEAVILIESRAIRHRRARVGIQHEGERRIRVELEIPRGRALGVDELLLNLPRCRVEHGGRRRVRVLEQHAGCIAQLDRTCGGCGFARPIERQRLGKALGHLLHGLAHRIGRPIRQAVHAHDLTVLERMGAAARDLEVVGALHAVGAKHACVKFPGERLAILVLELEDKREGLVLPIDGSGEPLGDHDLLFHLKRGDTMVRHVDHSRAGEEIGDVLGPQVIPGADTVILIARLGVLLDRSADKTLIGRESRAALGLMLIIPDVFVRGALVGIAQVQILLLGLRRGFFPTADPIEPGRLAVIHRTDAKLRHHIVERHLDTVVAAIVIHRIDERADPHGDHDVVTGHARVGVHSVIIDDDANGVDGARIPLGHIFLDDVIRIRRRRIVLDDAVEIRRAIEGDRGDVDHVLRRALHVRKLVGLGRQLGIRPLADHFHLISAEKLEGNAVDGIARIVELLHGKTVNRVGHMQGRVALALEVALRARRIQKMRVALRDGIATARDELLQSGAIHIHQVVPDGVIRILRRRRHEGVIGGTARQVAQVDAPQLVVLGKDTHVAVAHELVELLDALHALLRDLPRAVLAAHGMPILFARMALEHHGKQGILV